MIDPEDRFWVACESVTAGVHSSDIIDWDQRRWYTVKGSINFFPPEENVEIDVLKRYIDGLGQTVRSITIDDEGLLASVSSDPQDDPTWAIYYPRYSRAQSLHDCKTIRLSQLTELDRLGPEVDLVSYVDDSGHERKTAFKYNTMYQRIKRIWAELHLAKSLPEHPNLVPFDRVVLHDADSRVLGFTTAYVPGGTLDKNKNRAFRLEWLQQLTAVVDYLNLELGIIHQDVAPRNLLIEPQTGNLQLFDFDWAARVGQPGCNPFRDDVTGVIFTLYEIITQDGSFHEVQHAERDSEKIMSLEDWPVKGPLDSDIAGFRHHLTNWVRSRRGHDVAPNSGRINALVDTPDMPPPTPRGVYNYPGITYESTCMQRRTKALELEQPVYFLGASAVLQGV